MPTYDYDATGVEPMDTGNVPAGLYKLAIADYKEKPNKHQLPSFSIKCIIDEGNFKGRIVWHRVHILPADNKGAGIALHFLKSIGQGWEGKLKIVPENWIGRRFVGKVKIAKDQNGEDRNEISGIDMVPPGDPVVNMTVLSKYQQDKLESGDVPF